MGYLKAFGVFLIWASIALISHHFITNRYFNNCFDSTNPPNTDPEVVKEPAACYLLNEKNDTILKFANGFQIVKGSPEISRETDMVNALNDLLNNDYTKKLLIKGKYASDEPAMDSLNLGLLRAGKLYDDLLSMGIEEHQLVKSGVIDNTLFNTDSIYQNGVNLIISTLTDQEILDFEKSIENRRFYIDFNDEILEPTPELRSYAGSLKAYLNRNSEKNVYITGHTANAGYYQENLTIGQQRAEKIKQFFIDEEIEASKLVAQSRGEAEPIAPKGTPEGIRLNKRIEIQIK